MNLAKAVLEAVFSVSFGRGAAKSEMRANAMTIAVCNQTYQENYQADQFAGNIGQTCKIGFGAWLSLICKDANLRKYVHFDQYRRSPPKYQF